MRLGEANRLVVVSDRMVTGVAGGDDKTAAEPAVFGVKINATNSR